MYEEYKYYNIEYLTGSEVSTDTRVWVELEDTFSNPYRFDEAYAAMIKAKEIATEGKWGQPITLRVMKYIKKIENWHICYLNPKDYYNRLDVS